MNVETSRCEFMSHDERWGGPAKWIFQKIFTRLVLVRTAPLDCHEGKPVVNYASASSLVPQHSATVEERENRKWAQGLHGLLPSQTILIHISTVMGKIESFSLKWAAARNADLRGCDRWRCFLTRQVIHLKSSTKCLGTVVVKWEVLLGSVLDDIFTPT